MQGLKLFAKSLSKLIELFKWNKTAEEILNDRGDVSQPN